MKKLKASEIIFTSEDFCNWFLKNNDLSGFDLEDIGKLINEIKPQVFPCIPVSTGIGFDFLFITHSDVNQWSTMSWSPLCKSSTVCYNHTIRKP